MFTFFYAYKINLNKYLIDKIDNVMFMNIFVHTLVGLFIVHFYFNIEKYLNMAKLNIYLVFV